MKQSVWIFIFATIFAFGTGDTFARQLVVIERARIHTAQNESSPFTDVVQAGESLPVLGKSGIWFKTEYNGNEGWIKSAHVRLVSGTDRSEAAAATANLFTQQDVSMLPPSGPKGQRYGRVIGNNTKILKELSPDSPFLIIARKGNVFPLVEQGVTWCLVACKDTTGWVRCSDLEIFDDLPTSSLIVQEAKTVLFIVLGAGLIILIIAAIMTYNHIKADRQTKVSVRKKALILAKESKMVQSILTDKMTPIERCFLGFNVNIIKDSVTAKQSIEHSQPDIVLVDWNFEPSIFTKIENLFSRLASSSTVTYFLFYNVPDPSMAPQSKILKNVSFLGLVFSDRDIIKIVTPLIENSERETTKNVQDSMQRCALQGEISGGNLLEVLQFIELGSKTGCLMIETKGPFGLVYFNKGKIVYAAAAKGQGVEAVYTILNQPTGKFRFILNKHPKNANLNLSTLSVLMEWTKEKDEANRC